MSPKIFARYGIVTLINVALFYFLYDWYQKNIHWSDLVSAIRMVPSGAVFTAFTLGIAALCICAKRLSVLMDAPAKPSFLITCFGFGANNILPFRMGELLKIYFARRHFGLSAAKLFLVKIMEKFFDLAALLIIGLWTAFIGSKALNPVYLVIIGGLLGCVLLGTVILLYLLRRNFSVVARLRNNRHIHHFMSMYETVFASPALGRVALITAGIWALTVLQISIYFSWVLPDTPLHFVDVLALVFLYSFSIGIPSAPGALGVFEAAIVFYLNKFMGIQATEALALALVLHMTFAIPQILLMLTSIMAARFQKITSESGAIMQQPQA